MQKIDGVRQYLLTHKRLMEALATPSCGKGYIFAGIKVKTSKNK
jgi:hypothetical protein